MRSFNYMLDHTVLQTTRLFLVHHQKTLDYG